jgi:hypothetical protein
VWAVLRTNGRTVTGYRSAGSFYVNRDGVEMRYARGGGPSGTTNGLNGWKTEIGYRADERRSTACRFTSVITAVGPRSERRTAAAGSAVLRQVQSDFDVDVVVA